MNYSIHYGIDHREIASRGAKPCGFFKTGTFCWSLLPLGIARAHSSVGLGRRGGNISEDLFVFVCFTLKYKLHESIQIYIYRLYEFLFNLQNHPTFQSEERLVNIVSLRECFIGLSTVYYWFMDTSYTVQALNSTA